MPKQNKQDQVEILVEMQMLLQDLRSDGLEYLKGMIQVREKMIELEANRSSSEGQ